jgi:hypothetical protein
MPGRFLWLSFSGTTGFLYADCGLMCSKTVAKEIEKKKLDLH